MFPMTQSVSAYHLPTTAGQKQPYPGTADATVLGCLLPLDRKEHALEGDYVVQHELYVGGSADVRVSDKLVIDGVTYYVKSIFAANFGGLPHRRCSVSTEP